MTANLIKKSVILSDTELNDYKSRFEYIISCFGTIKAAARQTGYTRHQLYNWRDHSDRIPLIAAERLCKVAEVSTAWLLLGDEGKVSDVVDDLNLAMLAEVINEFESRMVEFKLTLSDPTIRSKLIPLLYQFYRETEDVESRKTFTKNMFEIFK